jgi:hypothetical protein
MGRIRIRSTGPIRNAYGYGAWYNSATGRYGYASAVYGPYGMAGGAGWYNPSTGRYGRAATVQTPWGRPDRVGQLQPLYRRGHGPYRRMEPLRVLGSSAIQRGNDWRCPTASPTIRHGSPHDDVGGRIDDEGSHRSGNRARRPGRQQQHVSGKDGNVYREGLQRRSGASTRTAAGNSVDKPQGSGQAARDGATRSAGSSSSDVTRDLNRDAGARQRGRSGQQLQQLFARRRQLFARRSSFRGGGGGRRR